MKAIISNNFQNSGVFSYPKLIFIITIWFAVFQYASDAIAITVTVNPSGAGDYTDLQEAIFADEVTDGSTILVAPGTYTAHTTTPVPGQSTFHIQKALTIQSTGGSSVTTLTVPATEYHYVVYIYADNVTLSGFTISGGYGG